MSDPITPAAPTEPTNLPAEATSATQPETDWQAKFEAQQKVNRDLETKFNGLRDSQTQQSAALAKALGLTPEATSDVAVLAATVETLQEQFTKTQLANTVLNVAAQHGITEKADVELLAAVPDEATMRTLAARIAASNTGSDPASPAPAPRPDLTQGAQGNPAAGDPATDFANFLSGQMA